MECRPHQTQCDSEGPRFMLSYAHWLPPALSWPSHDLSILFFIFFQKHHSVVWGTGTRVLISPSPFPSLYRYDPRPTKYLNVFLLFILLVSPVSCGFRANFCTKSAIESSDYVLKFPESCSLSSPISSEKSPKSRPIFGRLLWRHK